MANSLKNQEAILKKLNIEALNPMQEESKHTIHMGKDMILLSPTGTGKTLAFLLPIIQKLNINCTEVQALIITPSRELTIQIEQVCRDMGSGFKSNAAYGGRSFNKDKIDLKHPPAILIGTPGRIADHLRRGTFSVNSIKTLVLDEFDKSLEIGFEGEMKDIVNHLPHLEQKILTSATDAVQIPDFIDLEKPEKINFLNKKDSQLEIKSVISPTKDKLETLVELLKHLGSKPGIIFCNFKDSIDRTSQFLSKNGISHACFYGGMEQKDRERALIKFRNNTHQLLLATDLAARGIDVPEIAFIIHFHLPLKEEEFTHRNGRTARMNKDGTAYVLHWENEKLPDFISNIPQIKIEASAPQKPSIWATIMVSGGRKDKISKGDIAGLLIKQGGLKSEEIGLIEIKQDCAFVAVQKSIVKSLIPLLDNSRLKTKKVRLSEI